MVVQAAIDTILLPADIADAAIAGVLGLKNNYLKKKRRDGFRRPFESPTYSFDVVKTTSKVGAPIPVIYGRNRVGGVIVQAFVEGSTVVSSERLNVLILLGWGQVNKIGGQSSPFNGISGGTIQDVLVNNNPSSDFNNLSFSGRMGVLSPAALPNTAETVFVQSSTQTLPEGVTRTLTTNTPVKFIEVAISFPGGLFGINTNGSFIVGVQFDYEVYHSTLGLLVDSGTWIVNHENAADFTVRFKTNEIADYNCRIEIVRITEDHDNAFAFFSSAEWDGINEIGGDLLVHPGLALLEVTGLATEQFNGEVPDVTVIVEGKFVTIWDGVSTSQAYSNNPAWVALDILINKNYGLGRDIEITDVDLDSFKAWADYCDVLVNSQKRHTFDKVYDEERFDAFEAFLEVCDVGHGIPSFFKQTISIVIDQARDAISLVGMGCIYQNSFNMSYAQKKSLPDAVEVTFFDEENDYKQDTASVYTPSPTNNAYKILKTTKPGITNRERATREARYILLARQADLRQITFQAGPEVFHLSAGDRISFAHDTPGWGKSGRTGEVTTGVAFIRLDKTVTYNNGDKIYVQFINTDEYYEGTMVGGGTYSPLYSLNVTPDLPSIVPKGSQWALTGPDGLPSFVVDSIETDADMNSTLTCHEYNAGVYDESLVDLDVSSFTNLPTKGQAPADLLNITARATTRNKVDGTRLTTLDVYWDYPQFSPTDGKPRAYLVEVFFREDGTTFWQQDKSVVKPPESTASILNKLIPGTTYEVTAVPVSQNGDKKSPNDTPSFTFLFTGDQTRPATPIPFTATSLGEFVSLQWTRLTDESNIQSYVVKMGNSWAHSPTIFEGLGDSLLTPRWFPTGSAEPKVKNVYMIRAKTIANKFSSEAGVATIEKNDFGTVFKQYNPKTASAWIGAGITLTDVTVNADGDLECDNDTGTYEIASIATTPTPTNNYDVRVYIKSYQVDKAGVAASWTTATYTWDSSTAIDNTFEGPLDESKTTLMPRIGEFGQPEVNDYVLLNIIPGVTSVKFALTFGRSDTDYKIIIEELIITFVERP